MFLMKIYVLIKEFINISSEVRFDGFFVKLV